MDNGRGSQLKLANLAYGGLYSAAIGGSVAALVVLAADIAAGQPLFTPSLLGSVLFGDATAQGFSGVDLGAVALYTVVHIAAFTVVGWLASYLYEWRRRAATSAVLPTLILILVVTEIGFLLASRTVLPGVVERIGHPLILTTNVVTAVAMTLFLRWAYRQGARAAPADLGGSGRERAANPSPTLPGER